MRPTRLLAAAAALLVAAGSLMPASALPGETRRISDTRNGGRGNGHTPARSVPDVTSPAMSLDGRWVAFSSDASNLVPGDTNGVSDVFLYDLHRSRIKRISVARDGSQANGPSYSPALSVDGRFVAFVSSATNLLPGVTNGVADVYLLNRKTGRLRRISVSSSGEQANGPSNRPFVSLFGDWVTFDSAASNLVPKDDNDMPDAFLWRRKTGRTTRIKPPGGDVPAEGYVAWTEKASISWKGEAMSFVRKVKRAEAVLPTDGIEGSPTHLSTPIHETATSSDIFVRDRKRGRNARVRIPDWDSKYRAFADNPVISADGRRTAFDAGSVLDAQALSRANGEPPVNVGLPSDPIVDNPADHRSVFVYDRFADAAFGVSGNRWGVPRDGPSYLPSITAQGEAVAFVSEATNLVPGDDNGAPDVFVWDSRDGSLSRVSAPHNGGGGGASTLGSISYDGRFIAFGSTARELTGRNSGTTDTFVHDRRIDTPNSPPKLRKMRGVFEVNPMQELRIDLDGRDADGDPLRYDVIIVQPPPGLQFSLEQGPPSGSTLNRDTGRFRWTPSPHQAGPWTVVFWVGDPRGRSDIGVAQVVVRDLGEVAICTTQERC